MKVDSPFFLSNCSLFLYLSQPPTASNPMHRPPSIQIQYSNKSHSLPPQTPNPLINQTEQPHPPSKKKQPHPPSKTPRSTKQNNNKPSKQIRTTTSPNPNWNKHIPIPKFWNKSKQSHSYSQTGTTTPITNQPATTIENLKNTTLKPQTSIIVAVGTPVSDFKLRSSLQ